MVSVTGIRGCGLGSGTQQLDDFGQITYQYSLSLNMLLVTFAVAVNITFIKTTCKIISGFKTFNIVFKAVFLFLEYPFSSSQKSTVSLSTKFMTLRTCLSQPHRTVISSVFLQHFLHYRSILTLAGIV